MKKLLVLLFSFHSAFAYGQSPSDTIQIKRGLSNTYFFQGKRLNLTQLQEIVRTNTEASKAISKARTNNVVGSIFGLPGGFLLGFGLGQSMAGGKMNPALLGVGAGLIALAIPFQVAVNKNSKKGTYLFNKWKKQTAFEPRKRHFYFAISPTSAGVQLRF